MLVDLTGIGAVVNVIDVAVDVAVVLGVVIDTAVVAVVDVLVCV